MVTTESGKRANRGFMNLWHLTPKAFAFLRTTKTDALDMKGLLAALQRERHRFYLRNDPHYVYEHVFPLQAEIYSLLLAPHRHTQEEQERLARRIKEHDKLMAEIWTQYRKKPNPGIFDAVQRASDDAKRLNERTDLV